LSISSISEEPVSQSLPLRTVYVRCVESRRPQPFPWTFVRMADDKPLEVENPATLSVV
jgi:hypothetical protein